MGDIIVVIPYLAQEAQGSELALAVAGWQKHFKEPHRIVVVGDPHPVVDDSDIAFIPCPRVEPVEGQYTAHLDHVNKFLKVLEVHPEIENTGFIYTCDDIYAVRDFTLADVMVPKVSSRDMPPIDYRKEVGWFKDLGKTREKAAQIGWPTMNWVCHLPVWYPTQSVLGMIDRFDMTHNSYVMENLIFNRYYAMRKKYMEADFREPEFIPETGSPWKHGVQTSSPDFSDVEETGAVWITNANCGWSKRLEEILWKHYGIL